MENGKTSRKLNLWPFGKSGWACAAAGLILLGAAVLCLPVPAAAGTYKLSAHGNSTTGLYRNAGGVNWLNAPYSYSRGNCAHCHEEHASMGGAEGIPPAAATGSPSVYLGFAVEENLCLGCHDTGGLVGAATDDIDVDIDKAYGHGTGPANTLTMYQSNRHRAKETSVTGVSTSAHVECTDCHNPHVARTGKYTAAANYQTATGNVITGPSPLEGVDGVDFSAYPSNWANAASWSAAGANAYATATKEYQICFKCHSSSNSNTDDWDGNPATAAGWTDTALEFNTANPSFHPVVGPTSGDRIAQANLSGGWTLGDTMFCTDCHSSDSTPLGPHGSAVKWLLAGANKAWPYQGSANNGTSAGTYWTYNNRATNQGTANGLFCLNCHGTLNTGVHTASSAHQGVACVNCHIRVPHGGKLSKLITTDTAGLPNKYHPDGNGTFPTTGRILSYTNDGTGIGSCETSASGGCDSTHSSAASNTW